MISEEKMVHVLNLMLGGLEKADFVSYPNKGEAIREAKKAVFSFVSQLNSIAELAHKRIVSQKNPPPEYSTQYDTLYRKYYEEELRKKGL
jgi:uncharacterized protein